MPNPRSRSAGLKSVLRRGAALSVVFVVVVVCAFATLRLATPWLAQEHGTLERLTSAVVGRRVAIEGVAVEWLGLVPSLRLREVQIRNAAGDAVLKLGNVYMKPAVLASLFEWRLELAALHIVGADVHAVRRRDGEIRVRGLSLRPRAASRGLRDIALTLRSSRVRWEDHYLKLDYEFTRVNLALNTRESRNRLAARLALPRELGRRVSMVAELQGALREPATWQGEIYIKVEEVQIAAMPAEFQPGLRGELTLEGRSTWRSGRVASAWGHANITNVGFADADAYLDHLQGEFRWQRHGRGWTADLARLELARAGVQWPSNALSLTYSPVQARQARLTGALQYARLQDVIALLPPSWVGTASTREIIRRAPRGELKDAQFRVRLTDNHAQSYVVGGAFSNFGIDPTLEAPGVTGVDGRFRIDRNAGALTLDARAVKVRHPRLFARPLPLDVLKGPVHWRHEQGRLNIESPALFVANRAGKAQGRLLIRLGKTSPHVDLQFRLADADIARVARYLPVKILKPKTKAWLEHALVAGRLIAGQVMVRGNPADFPFRKGEGDFEARLRIKRGVLDYRPSWPRAEAIDAEVVFRDASVLARARRARVLESRLDKVILRISDLREGDLSVRAHVHGPANDALQYLRRADVVKPDLAEKLALAGNARLDLDLRIPLSEALVQRAQPRVLVRAQFKGAALRLLPWRLAFTNANGSLSFGPNGFHADAIEARFKGAKIKAQVAPNKLGRTQIRVHGRLPTAALMQGLEHPMLRQIRGASTWRARIDLPPLRRPDELVEPELIMLRLASDLEGTAVSLPSPAGKRAGTRRPFRLITSIGGGATHLMRVQYGQDISAVAALSERRTGLRLTRGELRVSRARAVLPQAGVFVKADLITLSLDDWRRRLSGAMGTPAASFNAGLPLRRVDVRVKRLELFGNIIENVRLTVNRGAQRWLAMVDSSSVKGHIAAPLDLDSQVPIFANLKYLYWTTVQGGEGANIDPLELPPLRFAAERLRINELEFTHVRLRAARTPDGLLIEALELAAPDFRGQIRGTWRMLEAGEQSSFDIMLRSPDLGSLLRHWDLVHTVRDGIGRVEAHLTWPGNPFRIDLKGLAGRTAVRAEDGRLRGLNPGAARLLGLLNIDVIARRLALDFSDLFRTGFSFDVIKGDFIFKQGALHTDNLKIDGPSAQIDIRGSTDLVARQYDLRVVVQPEIMSGLPLAGAIIGGPVVGAAVYVAGKIAEEIDPGIDERTKIPYSVQGSWNNPWIKPLRKPPTAPGATENFPHNQR